MQKIILVGYMAVGKTTIAHLLSQKTDFKTVDLDNLIEQKSGLSIDEIFKQKGELYFRKIEHKLFKEILESDQNIIISTGGGTPCYADNHLLLQGKDCVSFYLKASINVIFERLKKVKKNRPLVADKSEDELKEFIAKHLFERSYFYNYATFKISIDCKSSQAIVGEILELLN